MDEEIEFSRLLLSKGINYLPIFLGLKEAAIERYYTFLGAAAMGRLPKTAGLKGLGQKMYSKMAADYSNELKAWEALDPLLRHFKSNIRNVLAPMGIGTSNIDHGVLAHTALQHRSLRFGLYAEIPYVYMSDSMSMGRLRARVPSDFREVMLTRFNPAEKVRLFKKIYASQDEKRTHEAISAIGKELGEVVFWNR
jgi:hypothetical protein